MRSIGGTILQRLVGIGCVMAITGVANAQEYLKAPRLKNSAPICVDAQEGFKAPRLELGITIAAYGFSLDSALGRPIRDPQPNPLQYGLGFGARLGVLFRRVIGMEVEFVGSPALWPSPGWSPTAILALRGSLVLQAPRCPGKVCVMPFMLAGAGWQYLVSAPADFPIVDDSNLTVHSGLGLKVEWPTDSRLLYGGRVEVRAHLRPQIYSSWPTAEWETLLSFYLSLSRSGAQSAPGGSPNPPRTPSPGSGPPDPPPPPPTEKRPDRDTDHDGIVDSQDKCPAAPGSVENRGCPDKDTDGDGIVDRLDRCPNQPETKNIYQDEDGCPDAVPREITKYIGVIPDLRFEIGKAVIKKESFVVLDRVVHVLKQYPDLRLQIAGHTDDVGTAETNHTISQQRADAVKDHFIKNGIAGERLSARGHGFDKPLIPGKSAEARAKNRRVELSLLPTPAAAAPQPR